jgi:hypothetical protein
MNEFLETCKTRLMEAQKRFQAAQQSLQKAQQEFAQAQVEFNNWQGVVNSEMRQQAIQQQVAQSKQPFLPISPQPAPAATPRKTGDAAGDVNKTELVRELLAQHPEGMSPTEVWGILKNQIPRPYIYSILKRLKDNDQVIYQRRRKRYSLRVSPKSEEGKEQPIVH